jgi:hypothetical protein
MLKRSDPRHFCRPGGDIGRRKGNRGATVRVVRKYSKEKQEMPCPVCLIFSNQTKAAVNEHP